MLRGPRRKAEKDVTTWSVTRTAQKLFQNLGWALALAVGGGGSRRCGREGRLRIDHGSEWLDFGCREHWFGERQRLLCPVAITPGLIATMLLAVGGGSVALTGMPASPASCGFLAVRATVTCLWLVGQEPAFTALEQATARARVPAAGAESLTRRQRDGKLRTAHGRDCSRAVRRRGGGTSRRHFAPPTSSPGVGDPVARTCQRTCSDSVAPRMN